MNIESFGWTILASIISAALTSLFYWRKIAADLKREFEIRYNQKKWDLYYQYIDVLWKMGAFSEDAERFEKYFNDFLDVNTKIIMIGSDDLVTVSNDFLNSFYDLLTETAKDNPSPDVVKKLSYAVAEKHKKVLITIRSDLGFKTKIAEDELRDLLDISGSLKSLFEDVKAG